MIQHPISNLFFGLPFPLNFMDFSSCLYLFQKFRLVNGLVIVEKAINCFQLLQLSTKILQKLRVSRNQESHYNELCHSELVRTISSIRFDSQGKRTIFSRKKHFLKMQNYKIFFDVLSETKQENFAKDIKELNTCKVTRYVKIYSRIVKLRLMDSLRLNELHKNRIIQ